MTITTPKLIDQGDGTHVPVVSVSGGVGGGGSGSSDTTEATQLLVLAELQSLDSKAASLGQKVAAGSAPVVLASDQSPLSVDLTQGVGNADAKTLRVTLAADGPTLTAIGQTDTAVAPADGTGNYSVIAALKRILLNGASLLARVPTLGQKNAAGSLPVVIASDQVLAQNIGNKLREAFESYDPVSGGRWTQTLASGDIIMIDGNTAASSYLVISKDPLSVGESRITSVATWDMPFEAAIGLSMSQRTLGQEFSVEFVSDEAPLATPADLQISTMSQATTTLTVTTTAAHGLRPGMRIGIRDCLDSRMNYAALVVATTPSATQFTATAGPGSTIPSVTAGPFTSGFVYFRSAMGLAPNGTSLIFENATATNASVYLRSEAGDALPSGTITGAHGVNVLSTNSVQAVTAALSYAFQPTNEYRLNQFIDGVQWSNVPVDSLTASTPIGVKRTQVVPDINATYRMRIRATNNASLTRPIAQIVSAAKTGTTTATITTDVPHGLTTTDLIQAYGTRDQTNFANLATPTAVASIVSPTQFTVIWGTAVTATTFGGAITRVNGGLSLQGLVTNGNVQSITRTSNILSVVTLTAVSGLLVGDYINIVGARNAVDGASLGLDGAYRVRDIQTTTVFLEPIGSAPTGANVTLTNCGGVLIKRTDLRVSYARIMDFERQRVEMLARPSGDISAAASVNVQNVPAVTVNSGTVTTVTTVTGVTTLSTLNGGPVAEDAASTGNPLIMGGPVRTAAAPATLVAGDAARVTMTSAAAMTVALGAPVASAEVASAARTTTGNSGTISVPTGGAISGLIVVSAATGTTPTLDVTLEESYDNGTTWQQIWAAPRITASGSPVPIPAMEVSGVRRWVWTIGGATPSFTFAINTNQLTVPAKKIFKLFDRTANVLNGTVSTPTAALNVAGCTAITAKVAIGAAGTPATYQLQLSDDNVNWTNVGTATPAVANSQGAFSAPAGTVADWARVIVTSAGTGQTGTFVSIQATG